MYGLGAYEPMCTPLAMPLPITNQRSTRVCDLCIFIGSLMDKTDRISYDTTQIPSIMTVATVFTGSSIEIARFYNQSRGAYSRGKNTGAGTLAENGGVFVGCYGNCSAFAINLHSNECLPIRKLTSLISKMQLVV